MENNDDNDNDQLDLGFEEEEDADGDGAGNNNNILAEIDLDEDDEENENDSILDGGVAVNPDEDATKAKKHSSECDLLLYVYCLEPLDLAPNHPIIRPGITVSIGLDKTTKLKAVFRQYVDFCNTSSEAVENGTKIDTKNLEFSFCQLLQENDTAETSALMKNDRIRVRKVRTAERSTESERKRVQRDSDRGYFQQMRQLLRDSGKSRVADVVFDCQGKLVDKNGRNQRVLSTTVRAHSSMISKRCDWLMDMILQEKQKLRREAEEQKKSECETPVKSTTRATEIEDDGEIDGNDETVNGHSRTEVSGAAKIDMVNDSSDDGNVNIIVVDDDEDDDEDIVSSSTPYRFQSRSVGDLLVVALPNHSPEAVKILLEYCYTNRVVSLGHDAFVQACRTRPNKHQGPVPPFPTTHSQYAKRWPNNGIPVVPFSVALAAISLAEEAGMHRLSLMCEISASQLVSSMNVVEALTISTRQKGISGNDLPRLRKAAMDVILRRGRRGVAEIGRSVFFKKALNEERSIIVPTLFQGTMEAVTHYVKSGKRDISEISNRSFRDLDKEDSFTREKERKYRRKEKTKKNHAKITAHLSEYEDYDFSDDDEDDELFLNNWATKRNMDSITRRSSSRGSNITGVSKISQRRSSRITSSQKVSQKLEKMHRSRRNK